MSTPTKQHVDLDCLPRPSAYVISHSFASVRPQKARFLTFNDSIHFASCLTRHALWANSCRADSLFSLTRESESELMDSRSRSSFLLYKYTLTSHSTYTDLHAHTHLLSVLLKNFPLSRDSRNFRFYPVYNSFFVFLRFLLSSFLLCLYLFLF